MTGLIKSGAAGFEARVRPLGLPTGADMLATPPDPELIDLRERVLDLEARLAERGAEAARLAEAAEAAYGEGEAAGRETGLAEADERRAEALALLETALKGARAAFDERLKATERLAALLARTALEKMFGAPEARAEIVAGLIHHQLATLNEEAAVEIRVSAEDFDADAAAAAAPGCAIVVSDALASGDCAIRLRLGALDIGLGQQWGALRAALDSMIGEEAAS